MTPRAKINRVAARLMKIYGPASKPSRGDVLSSLIETILSQNTTDLNSGRAFENLRRHFPAWEDALRAGPAAIERLIRVGGLARTKAGRIHELLKDLRSKRGRFGLEDLRELSTEKAIEALLAIRGVGPKTALVVVLFELGRPVFPMDTHVHRVLTRLAVIDGDRGRIETHRRVESLAPADALYDLHLHLIRFGREVCKPRPLCKRCPFVKICEYPDKTA